VAELRYWFGDRLRAFGELLEDLWFDLSRNVQTSQNVSRELAGTGTERFGDSEGYEPARPRHIRRALLDISAKDVTGYSYIDLGSGKGRTLFVAAEFPFHDVTGVELSPTLHRRAFENVHRFRWRRRRCGPIVAVQADAKEFAFPDRKLVVYLFNPFGAATTKAVLANLNDSLRRNPRHAIVILLWPKYPELLAGVDSMRLRRATRVHQIFEAWATEA
jgi:SAM-dependent methyltransferase